MFRKAAKDSVAHLKVWSKGEFGGRKKKLELLIEELKSLQLQGLQHENGDRIKTIERQIDTFLSDEEIYWKQRSKADWLKERDRNTKFFHAKASSRKRKNKIWGILDKQDKWTEEVEDIERMFYDYFANLFTSTNPL